jgi:hypothetical protein
VLGNSVKPCHPRKVGLPKFMKQVREAALWRKVSVCEKGANWRVYVSFWCFASSWTDTKLIAEQGPCIRTFDLFQDMRFLRESGTRRSRKYEIRKSWESGDQGPTKLWNHRSANLRVQISEIQGSRMEDSRITKKPSQRRYPKSPGLACELVAGL